MSINTAYKMIQVEVDGRVGTITLNLPDRLNALQSGIMRELNQVLKEINAEPSIQVVVLKGEGRAFCSGGDIKSMLEITSEDAFQKMMDAIAELSMTIFTLEKITICQVHGAAAGLGMSLALAHDVVVAEESSKLAMNFIGIGLVPDGGGHYFLKERVGSAKAMQLIWAGKKMNGQEAYSLGLVDHVVAEGQAGETVRQLVQSILQQPVQAMLETKSILRATQWRDLKKVLELEEEGQWRMRQTADHQEGIQAFVEKRKPDFKGE